MSAFYEVTGAGASTSNSGSANKAAFDTAASTALSLGVPLFIPAGEWLLDEWWLPAGLVVVGAGKGRTVLKRPSGAANNSGVAVINADDVTIRDLTMDGNKSGNSWASSICWVPGCKRITLEKVEFRNAKMVSGSYGAGLVITSADTSPDAKIRVIDCSGNGNEASGVIISSAKFVDVVGGHFDYNGLNGVEVVDQTFPSPDLTTTYIRVIDARCSSNGRAGLAVIGGFLAGGSQSAPIYGVGHADCAWVHVSRPICENNYSYGLVVQGLGVLVDAPICRNNATGVESAAQILFNAEFSTLLNPWCSGPYGTFGIDAGGAYYCNIQGGVLQSCAVNKVGGGLGLNLGGARGTRLSGMVLYDNGGDYGVQMALNAVESDGSPDGGYAWEASDLVISGLQMGMTSWNQKGMHLTGDPKNVVVHDCYVSGGDPMKAFLFEGPISAHNNAHLDYSNGYVVTAAATLVLPDWCEKAVVLGSTTIERIRTYSRNAKWDQVTAVHITNGGSGYSTPPDVSFSGGGGSGAAGVAIISPAGQVTGVLMTNWGSGYSSPPAVSFANGGGSGATADSVVGVSNIRGKLILVFGTAATVQHGDAVYLNNGTNFSSGSGGTSTLSLQGMYGSNWHEVGRSV